MLYSLKYFWNMNTKESQLHLGLPDIDYHQVLYVRLYQRWNCRFLSELHLYTCTMSLWNKIPCNVIISSKFYMLRLRAWCSSKLHSSQRRRRSRSGASSAAAQSYAEEDPAARELDANYSRRAPFRASGGCQRGLQPPQTVQLILGLDPPGPFPTLPATTRLETAEAVLAPGSLARTGPALSLILLFSSFCSSSKALRRPMRRCKQEVWDWVARMMTRSTLKRIQPTSKFEDL